MKSPIVLLTCLFDDLKRLVPDVKGLDRDIITIEARVKHEGYSFLSVSLSSLCDALDRGLTERRFVCPLGFKRVPRGALPRLFSGLLNKVFDTVTGHLKDAPDLGAIKCLRETLRLFKKASCDTTREETLHGLAVASFFETEKSVLEVFDPTRIHFLEGVCKFILRDLALPDLENISCKHGPGAVHEKVVGNQKWLLTLRHLFEVDVSRFGYDALFSSVRTESFGMDLPALPDRESSSRRTAKLITVPKNSTSRRTITVEPLLNQFVQQGLNTLLRSEIDRCSVLSNCLALTDQTLNQNLALIGSRTGEWATIDLSSASDLLGKELVKVVFGRCPLFLEAALDCRSPWVKSGNSVSELKKFAGMGNALTFPVQSVVFATIAIAAILHLEGRRSSYRDVVRASRCVRVYGDDIIVRTEHAHQVVNWLHSFGLRVNKSKSFVEGNFRESCGLDAFMGVDVTPVYLRSRPDIASVEPDVIAGLVSTSNQLWMRALYRASACLSEEVEGRLKRRLPLVSQKSGALGWHSRVDASEAQKWDPKLQRLVLRAPVVVAKKYSDRLDGYAALLKFFHVPLIGRSEGHLRQSQRRFSSRISMRWVPAIAG
jgi:hypothetical protein